MEDLQPCIEACAECARVSREGAAECLKSPQQTELGRLLLDNAALCGITMEVLARASQHHGDFCAVNRHINLLCAGECDRVLNASELLRRCRDACLRCAAECQKHVGEADF